MIYWALALIVAVCANIGQITGFDWLTHWGFGCCTMKLATQRAICLICLANLIEVRSKFDSVRNGVACCCLGCGFYVITTGWLTYVLAAFNGDTIAESLKTETPALLTVIALLVSFTGSTLEMLRVKRRGNINRSFVMAVGLSAIFGMIFNQPLLYGDWGWSNGMALPTAVCLCLIGFAK